MGSDAVFCLVLSCCFLTSWAASSPSPSPSPPLGNLSATEVAALKIIAKSLGKTDWDFGVDPCSGEGNWRMKNPAKGTGSDVICSCIFKKGNTCHVTNISLKGQSLPGVLPPEFAKFKHLHFLDLSRNMLRGSVPAEWASMKLQTLSLMGNRLSGPFPEVLTKITTLNELSIEGNRFTGPIPAKIGDLVNMGKLVISANDFSGELPGEIAKLTNLTDLRICSNNFSGKIPKFITKLTQLQKLHIQGSSLEGPIPSGISVLTNLTDLRISDLKGNMSYSFPDLSRMGALKTLMLRNCSIHGDIPSYIGDIKTLKLLDVSFNKLSGSIPSSFDNLRKIDFIYLTQNMLTGSIPKFFFQRSKTTDVSYNNFTVGSSSDSQCDHNALNTVESYSPVMNTNNTVSSCIKKNFPCRAPEGPYQYALHINCGGKEVTINGTKFEADTTTSLASTLYHNEKWAFSSTGNFMDDDNDPDEYIHTVPNISTLLMPNPELYTNARLSPLSLTYYGLCMLNGLYTVELHFAEIMFRNDKTYNSLGKRLFNVYIQGKLVLEDFNIEAEANGTLKPTVKVFTTVNITDNTLKIQLYWAGKGTTGIPTRGVYGPLISAISVKSNFDPPDIGKSKRLIITVAVSILVFIIIISFVLLIVWRKRSKKQNSMHGDLGGLGSQTGCFTLRQIKAATNNFDAANKVGEGGFGSVYKGVLSDGTIIAVKQLSSRSRQGNREFLNEIGVISALQHPNLVKLYGCCIEGNQLLLVYEYMENNCLSRALFDTQRKLNLDWPTRCKICLGIARGLAYIHEESRLRIVHRDIKASNVLLDGTLNAKISDFGLAKLHEEDHSHISTRVAGTIGYMAPEYAMRGHLTDKADVYSFGVVALEIVSGKSNTNYRPKEEFVYLLDWACVLQEKGTLLELVDPDLGSKYSKEEAMLMLHVALLCTNASPTLRPPMSNVVSLLEGRTSVQPLLSRLSFTGNIEPSSGVRRNFWQYHTENQTVRTDLSCTDSTETAESYAGAHVLVVSQSSDHE